MKGKIESPVTAEGCAVLSLSALLPAVHLHIRFTMFYMHVIEFNYLPVAKAGPSDSILLHSQLAFTADLSRSVECNANVQVRTLVRRDFDTALSEYDVLMAPVAATAAYRFGEKTDHPLEMYMGDQMTVNLNLAGLPAVVLNCGFDEEGSVKLPVGMQLIGKHLSEAQLLGVAHVLQQTHDPARVFPQYM